MKSYKKILNWIIRLVVVAITIYLFRLNYVRIFEENLWGDEAFTGNIIRMSIPDLIHKTAIDVHPPLYYLVLKFYCAVFGQSATIMHAFSLIPLAIMLVFSLTIGWKEFGYGYAILSVVLLNIADCSVRFNVEVRMYTLAAMLVFFSYIMLYRILVNDGKLHDYLAFFLFSIAAAYTHYYALIAVTFYYVVLFFIAIFNNKKQLKYIIMVCILAIVSYLPWINILLQSFKSRINNYWIAENSSYSECFNYLTSNTFNWGLWVLLVLATIIAFLYEIKLCRVTKLTNNEWKVGFYKDCKVSNRLLFVIAGFISVIGTMAVGIIISDLFSPFFVTRYIYVVAPVFWLLMGVILGRLQFGKVFVTVLAIFLYFKCLPQYQETAYWDVDFENRALPVINSIQMVDDDDIIISNDGDCTIADYYFAEKNHFNIVNPDEINWDVEKDSTIWIYMNDSWSIDMLYDAIDNNGFTYEAVVEGGILGKSVVNVYKIYKQ